MRLGKLHHHAKFKANPFSFSGVMVKYVFCVSVLGRGMRSTVFYKKNNWLAIVSFSRYSESFNKIRLLVQELLSNIIFFV